MSRDAERGHQISNSEETIRDNRVFAEQSGLQIYRGIRSEL